MKKLIGHDIGNWIFSPSTGKITFTGVSLSLEQILVITNTTSNTIIYNFANSGFGGTLAANVLTLAYNTSAMSASDSLQIWVDIPDVDSYSLFSGSISASGAGPALDTTGFGSVIIQMNGTSASSSFVGTVYIEGSNDQSSGSWNEQFVLSIDEFTMTDGIYNEGQYAWKAATRYIRYNVITLGSGAIAISMVGRKYPGPAGADMLAIALDQNSGVNLSVSVQNLKTDTQGSLILSDAPNSSPIIGTGNIVNKTLSTVDTTGYQSISLQIYGTWAGTVSFQTSNDAANWFPQGGWNTNAPASTVSSTAGNGIWSIPSVGRFFRIVITAYTSGIVQSTIFLRNQPASPMLQAPNIATNSTVNVAQWAGTAGPSAGVGGTVAVGGNVAPGSAPTTFPNVVAGTDLSNFVRRLSVDSAGRLYLGGISSTLGIQGIPAVGVMDLSQYEGQSIIEILFAILTELKIHSQYHADLPVQLQAGSGYTPDAPETFRNDPTFFQT